MSGKEIVERINSDIEQFGKSSFSEREFYHEKRGDCWHWQRGYSDVSACIELHALYDDVLKKNEAFTNYAVIVARHIAEDNGLPCIVSWGKWGARLETAKNRDLTESELEGCASIITNSASWQALKQSSWVFTFGKDYDKVPCKNCGHEIIVFPRFKIARHYSFEKNTGTVCCNEDKCSCKKAISEIKLV